MSIVQAQITVSLDGYIAGPNAGPGNPLGDRGAELHQWSFGLRTWRKNLGLEGGVENEEDVQVAAYTESNGAHIMGRNMFDEGEEPWGPNPPFHAPVFVLTSRPREPLVREGGTTFHFVTNGLQSALEQANAAAGDKNVAIGGGARTIVEFLDAGLLDEFTLHYAPKFLGGGVRLFDALQATKTRLDPVNVLAGQLASHVTYRVRN